MGLFDFWKKGKATGAGAPSELSEWIAKLGHADSSVRLEACRALKAMGRAAAPASERLHELLDDEDGDVCNAAAAALSEIDR